MKKTQIKQRIKNAIASFFGNQTETVEYQSEIDFFHQNSLQQTKPIFSEKFRSVFTLLKQIFIFFPATFFTFYMWMGMVIFGLPTVDTALFILLLLVAPLLMLVGLGNIKNLKHLAIPASVIGLGSLIGIIVGNVPFLRRFIQNFENAILLFPLALIVAVLSKSWVDSFDRKDLD